MVQRSWVAMAVALLSAVLSVGMLVQSRLDARSVRRDVEALRVDLASYGAGSASVSPEAVRQALLADPTMLMEAGRKLRDMQRDAQRRASIDLVAAVRDQLMAQTRGVIGNPSGKHVIVEFFDYQCAHCREVEEFLVQEAKHDPELKILRREVVMLGEGSEIAARFALAAARQGLYDKVSAAMLALPTPITASAAEAAAKAAGADPGRLMVDVASEAVTKELSEAQSLSVRVGVSGTPAFSAPGAGTMIGVSSPSDFRAFVNEVAP